MVNLCPGMGDRKWNTWAVREELTPAFEKGSFGNDRILKISSAGKFENYGKWVCRIAGIKGGDAYRFSVQYKCENVTDENVSIAAMLSWENAEGTLLARDFADRVSELEDGWKCVDRVIETSPEAGAVTVELVLRWSENGSVIWRKPELSKVEPAPHRIVRIASASFTPNDTPEANLASIIRVLDRIGGKKPDIICMGESAYQNGTGIPAIELAETPEGRAISVVMEKARVYGTYIVYNTYERDGAYVYNTSFLINRGGEIAGKYRKTHLPLFEAECGVTPGSEYPVFKTDFGVIGMMTCYDHYFPEPARILRKNGAEIVFVPTQGYIPVQSRARALDNGIHIVISGWNNNNPDRTCIIAPDGKILCSFERPEDEYIISDVDIDKRYLTYWLSIGNGFGEARSLYMKERRTDTYSRLTDNTP